VLAHNRLSWNWATMKPAAPPLLKKDTAPVTGFLGSCKSAAKLDADGTKTNAHISHTHTCILLDLG
jgi:hypothetical protein